MDRLGIKDRFYEPKIEQLDHVVDTAPLGRKDVARLDVAVDQPYGVGLGPLEQLVLGQEHLAHPASADPPREPVLSQLAGLECLTPQPRHTGHHSDSKPINTTKLSIRPVVVAGNA
jgi:hypothetical protein